MEKKVFYEQNYAKNYCGTSKKYRDIAYIFKQISPKNFLDIGCGDGSFIQFLQKEIPGISVKGIEMGLKTAQDNIISLDVDKEPLPFKDNTLDAIFCGELIEHLFDPDHLLCEIHRVLKPNGVCILTTPNLAFWFNRLTLLLGFQPITTEVSTKHHVGYPIKFWKSDNDGMAGHIRPFTYKSIVELIKLNDFKIISTKGYGVDLQYMLGKKGKILAKIVNFLFPTKGACYDILVAFSKT